jgi:hypothetical protein
MPTNQDILLMRKDYSMKLYNTKTDLTSSSCIIEMPSYLQDSNYRNVYSKALPHSDLVSPNSSVYQSLVQSIRDKNLNLLYSIVNQNRKLVDVYCILDSELLGIYRSSIQIDPAPEPLSNHAAGELLEVYAMALLRDVPFSEWSTNLDVANTINNLNLVKDDLNAPLESGNITVNTLFRGPAVSGNLIGPYVSQFLWQNFTLGGLVLKQLQSIPSTNDDYLTDPSGFVANWNSPMAPVDLNGSTQRYLLTIRDCANSHHLDQLWQIFFIAATILLNKSIPFSFTTTNRTGIKFINLGPVDLFDQMMTASKLAMNSAWMWKWCQLRYRPEEMAYQVHLKKAGSGLDFPSILLDNPILQEIHDRTGTYLMPVAFPEGSPSHPSYPAGHSTVAGAMATIVKAFFNCNRTIQAKVPNADGSELVDLVENGQVVELNIGDELNKLAYNCAIFRNFAGVHYRSDGDGGILIGEQVGIQLLEELSTRYEGNVTFTLKKMNGETITISNNK